MRNLLLPYANNKGADQLVHPHSLISTFVVLYLDSITLRKLLRVQLVISVNGYCISV